MSYQKRKLSLDAIASILSSLETAIHSMIRDSEQPIASVNLLGENDEQLIQKWNSPVPQGVQSTLHALFEDQARQTPNACATSGFDGEYTYAELNSLGDKLAAYFATEGEVGLETKAILCFNKSTWPIVSMIAVLKSGGVVVSTNPEHPTSRIIDICDDVKAPVILCDKQNADRFRGQVKHVIAVDQDLVDSLPDNTQAWTPPIIKPSNAAFVVYTSGSTGKPKGAVLEHTCVSTSQLVNAEAMAIDSSTRAVQFASYTFDASICEIFAPLVVGGCVCVISDEERLNDLPGAINAREADWIMLTPTVAQLFGPSAVPSLKTLVFGGEALTRKALDMWSGQVYLVNYWGPSECSNSGCLNRDIRSSTDPMNIGRPSGCCIWITEPGNPDRLLPIGYAGEIVVEGPMLAREYINRPEVTSRTFVGGLAWAGSSSRRFYRTGDLARFNSDGSVTFVGRADSQVKIHGQRVELDEIKHQVVLRLPTGSEAVIDVLKDMENDPTLTLAAFIKLPTFIRTAEIDVEDPAEKDLFKHTVSQLEVSLAEVLPQYMIPSLYVPIAFVPTNASAKTDRQRLRSLAKSKVSVVRDDELDKAQPRNEMERDLQLVWSQVFKRPISAIGIDDSFMSLGGDSITAMQAVALCRKAGINIGVSAILRKKTISAMAPHCTRASLERATIKLASSTEDSVLFALSPIQQRYFEQEHLEGNKQYNQSLMLNVKPGTASVSQVKEAFDIVVQRHALLRSRYVRTPSGDWQQQTLPPVEGLYHFGVSPFDEEEIVRIAQRNGNSLDIVNGPVFSVQAFDVDDSCVMLFLAAHHLVIDIVSWQVIIRNVEEFLKVHKVSDSNSISFQQWCGVQQAEITSGLTATDVLPASIPIPPSNVKYWGIAKEENIWKHNIIESFDLPIDVTDLLMGQSNQAFGTVPLEILLGTLLSSFSTIFTDRETPTLFVEHHGRESPANDNIDLSQVVGWFTTMYPLHVSMDKNTPAGDAVRLLKDARRAVPLNGRQYFAYRHLTQEGEEAFASHDPPELLINFTGGSQELENDDSILSLETKYESSYTDANPDAHRWAMIDVEIGISKGAMTVRFFLHQKMSNLPRVREWMTSYRHTLMEVASSLAVQKPVPTPGDFPLLDLGHLELEDFVRNDLPCNLDNVQDMLPLSGFQKVSIEGHQDLSSPRHWSTFYINVPADVDSSRLQDACSRVVNHHPLLRTIFVNHKATQKLVQVVLNSCDINFSTLQTEDALDEYMEQVFAEDRRNLSQLGASFLRFMLIRSQSHSRLLLRLSHAQFDALSQKIFVQSLAQFYESDNYTSPILGYDSFLSHSRKHENKAYQHWQSLLSGSENPTTVLENTTNSPSNVLHREKLLPALPTTGDVTSATRFNAACAMLIQSLTGSSDVIFGRLTAGRAGLDAELQNLLGPCLNIVPIRIKFENSTSPEDIVQSTHRQYLDSIPYETTSLDDIIRKCTPWSTSLAKMPIITQHVNLEDGSVAQTGQSEFDIRVWEPSTSDPFPWSLCLGAFPGRDGVKISIAANQSYISEDMMDKIMEGLCNYIDIISRQ